MADDLSKSIQPLPLAEKRAALEPPASGTEQFLRLKLFPNITALLPMHQLSEVLTIPIGQVVPIPDLPAWVMGIYNWRGEILWIADLSHFLGLTVWNQQVNSVLTYTIVVLNVPSGERTSSTGDNPMMGLIVNQTEDIEWCSPQEFQASIASSMNPELTRFLRGYWLKTNGEMLAILDGTAILNSMAEPQPEAAPSSQ